jgi:23S rRNA pseudouridine955/2504/2580 synthase
MKTPDEERPAAGVPPVRSAVQRLTVGEEDAGQRLDKVLTRLLPQVPRSHLYRLLRKGEVRVNGKRPTGEQRLVQGDELRIPPLRVEAEPNPAGPDRRPVPRTLVALIEKSVVHEDERLLALNKPAGVAVHGGSGISFGVIEALRASRPEEELELVHRLDRDTSGCLLVARRRSSLRALHALMRDESSVDKRYLALLKGKWELGAKLIDAPLNVEARVGGERTVRVDPRGKSAASQFRVVQFFGQLATLVEVQLLTGRTHQIRVHAAHAGHPVAGDPKYGDPEFNEQLRGFGLGRMFLHAHSIGFPDVQRRVDVSISAPLPDDLKKVLDELVGAAARKVRPAGPRPGQALLLRAPKTPRPAARRKPRSTAGR